MDTYLKTIAVAAVGILLCLILSKNAKDYSFVISIVICSTLLGVAVGFLKPIFSLMEEIWDMSGNNGQWLAILLKVAGLSLIGETVSTISSDAGHGSAAKVLQFLTTVVIMWVCIPLIQSLLDLIQSILEML